MVLSLRRAHLAGPVALCGLFVGCYAAVHVGPWAHGQLVDTPTYQRYGDLIVRHAQVPYRDFALEYPPGALPTFAVPSLVGDYARTFSFLMGVCGALLVLVLARLRPAAAAYAAISPLLIGSLVFSRFDFWPALLVAAAVAALLAERHRLGWALLGVAVAAKLWPLALVPLGLVWSWRRGRLAASLVGAAAVAVCFVPFAVLGPHGLWSSLHGEASRPLQVESLGAAFLTTFGHPQVITSHGSQNLAGQGAVAALESAATIVALVLIWVGFARGPASRERLLRFCAAATAVVVAFGKVLSPQFLIWLVPLVPLVRGRRGAAATALLTAALLLTQVWFPRRYFEYALDFHLAGVVLARDLVLVALAAVLALPLRHRDA